MSDHSKRIYDSMLGLLSGVSRSLDSKVDLLPVVLPYVFGGGASAPVAPSA